MRRAACLLLALALVSGCRLRPGNSPPALPKAGLTLPDGKTIAVELALTPRTRERGLMFREALPPDYGMLFVFPSERPLQFWMKNTFVSLDMVFVGADKRVTAVYEGVPRSAPDTPEPNLARRSAMGRYVLELPEGSARGHGVKEGTQLKFEAPEPEE